MSSTAPAPSREPNVDGWVEAAPFRAQLNHLMAAGDLSSGAAAAMVGISPRLAHRLVHGRGGRPLRRIDPHTARKLLRVTTADARAARRLTVAAEPTVQHLSALLRAGWSQVDLTRLLGVEVRELEALLSGSSRSCTQLVALRASAEAGRLTALRPLAAALAGKAA